MHLNCLVLKQVIESLLIQFPHACEWTRTMQETAAMIWYMNGQQIAIDEYENNLLYIIMNGPQSHSARTSAMYISMIRLREEGNVSLIIIRQ